MKSILLSIALFTFMFSAQAQNNDLRAENEKQRRDYENLQKSIALSEASKALHERLTNPGKREVSEILQDAVRQGDKSVVPYLKARKEGGYGPAQYIDLALVALGETQYVDLAIEETKSNDPVTRYWATWRLARFKTKASYRRLYEMLDDDADRNDYKCGDCLILTMSMVTKDMLSSEVKDPPKEQFSTQAWKEWFKKNNLIDLPQ